MTVEELLVEEKIPFKMSPADFVVSCLNPEHDDSNPSMRIDKITGVFNCFSCGYKGNIFKLFDKPSNYLDIKRGDRQVPSQIILLPLQAVAL